MSMIGLGQEEAVAVWLSFKVATVAVLASIVPAVLLGWMFARHQFRGKTIVETIVMLPLVLPPVVVGYVLLDLFGRRGMLGHILAQWFGVQLVFTWWGAALASAMVGFPFFVRSARLGFDAIDPRLEKIARTLGAGRWRAFVQVSLPLAWPAILSGAVLAFARGWGEFGATIMVAGNIAGRTRTVPLAIYGALESSDGMSRAWPLVVVSVATASAAMFISEWLSRRAARPLIVRAS